MAKPKSKGKGIKSKGPVLVICAHSDDQIIGPGGAMAKYAKEGYEVHTIILSFGEGSHPYFRREIISKSRIKEAQRADKIIGGKGVTFLGLKELQFEKDFDKRAIANNFKKIIRKIKPIKIFTHSSDDAFPDHRATFAIVLKLYKEMKLRAELYTFEVWHLFNLKKRKNPKLVVDTSETFKLKKKAFNVFKSQKNIIFINLLFFLTQIKDLLSGIKNNTKYAEVFYKVR